MSAALRKTPEPKALLEAPYSFGRPADLLAYFKGREHIRYFPVLDEEQVTPDKLAGILENRFEFNNEAYSLPEGIDWLANPSTDEEWQILLHKFYYAVGLGRAFQQTRDRRYRDKWVELTRGWMASVPLDFMPSDVAGRRIQNWIFAYYYFVHSNAAPGLDPEFHLDFLNSIQQQVAYLCEHLTPARNHRTLELYAVFLAAVVFPELKGASQWLDFARHELKENIRSDLLDDGVHCELSTDYHHIVLRNFLGIRRLAALNGIELPEAMDAGIRKALEFSLYVHKPDGFIPSISDGDTACFLDLLKQGHELYQDPRLLYVATLGQQGTVPAERSMSFPASGYSIVRSSWGGESEAYADARYLFFDCGPLGAGNHGHLDLLNIEMAAYGRSLVVDPGRYTYDESGPVNWRVLFRGTSYHNTVEVDGRNQTRYAPHTRKYKIQGPEPQRELRAALSRPGLDYLHGIAASHEYPVIHERKILFVSGEYWLICDLLRAEEPHDYVLRYHLDPLAENHARLSRPGGCLRVDSPNLVILQPPSEDIALDLEPGFVSPTYGVKHPAPVVRFSARGDRVCFHTLLFPYQESCPDISVGWLPLAAADASAAGQWATALSLTHGGVRDEFLLSHTPGSRFRLADVATDSPFLYQRKDLNGVVVCRHDAARCFSGGV